MATKNIGFVAELIGDAQVRSVDGDRVLAIRLPTANDYGPRSALGARCTHSVEGGALLRPCSTKQQ